MKNFKLDIYQKEWLDIIFSNRNQSYGAYELRKTASASMNKALVGVLLGVTLLVGAVFAFGQRGEVQRNPYDFDEEVKITLVDLEQYEEEEIIEPIIPEMIEKEEAPRQLAEDLPAEDQIRFPEPKIVSADRVTEDVASQDDIKGKMTARMTLSKVEGGTTIPKGEFGTRKRDGAITGGRDGSEDNGGNADVPFTTVQIMPEPIGGMAAFVKWVADNYQFPPSALDNRVQGVIEVAFVVEKDGSLTDITVNRDMGYGTGEEAVKLLKLAKKWNAGVQNGRPVRVAYRMPIRLSAL